MQHQYEPPATILICVYCGMPYPEGTPPHSAKILTEHIKTCEKHPLKKAMDSIQLLQDTLAYVVSQTEPITTWQACRAYSVLKKTGYYDGKEKRQKP